MKKLLFLVLIFMLIFPSTAQTKVIDLPHKDPLPYPDTIRVRITGVHRCEKVDGKYTRIETVDFEEYVKTVLAGEWYDVFPYDSIKAGAMAVKHYALNAVRTGGKWGGAKYGHVYDCDWDQVYDPKLRFELTDKAVEETWDYLMINNKTKETFVTYYLAYHGACVNIMDLEGECMGAWDSKKDAERGLSWKEILRKYYYDYTLVRR